MILDWKLVACTGKAQYERDGVVEVMVVAVADLAHLLLLLVLLLVWASAPSFPLLLLLLEMLPDTQHSSVEVGALVEISTPCYQVI